MNSQKTHVKKESKAADKSKDRKKSIAIISVLFGGAILIVLLSLAMLSIVSDDDDEKQDSINTYIFYEPDYEFDIMNDDKYLELDRQIYFENPETGITVVVDKEKLEDVPNDQKEYISLLCDFVNYAINGQSEEFNALFSEEYIEADGKIKMDFTMQQLYNIKITYVDDFSEVVEGETLESYDYWIEYMIRKNNGTFRSDMESDCTRKEYIRITKREESIGIDALIPYTTTAAKSEIIETGELVTIMILGLVTVATFAGVSIALIKKK